MLRAIYRGERPVGVLLVELESGFRPTGRELHGEPAVHREL